MIHPQIVGGEYWVAQDQEEPTGALVTDSHYWYQWVISMEGLPTAGAPRAICDA